MSVSKTKPKLDLSELDADLVALLSNPDSTHEERVEALLLALVREMVKVKDKIK